MRARDIAVLVGVIVEYGCARPRPVDLMMMEPVCDTIPRPLAPGEVVGGAVPAGIVAVAERGILLGVVLEAGTRRALQGARVRLYHTRSDTGLVQVGHDVWTNASGAFQLEPQLPAEYALTINRIGYSARTQVVLLQAGVGTRYRLNSNTEAVSATSATRETSS